MLLQYLLLLPLGALAYPAESEETRVKSNQDKLKHALIYFGLENFTWPELDLEPVYHPGIKDDEIAEPEEDKWSLMVEAKDTGLEIEEEPLETIDDVKAVLDIGSPPNTEVDDNFTIMIPADHPVLDVPPEPDMTYIPITENPVYILHHPANDDPADPDKDIYHILSETDSSRPICSYFQHSVLGADFGESTFPRVSYVSSETLPFRVHYAPDDDLHFESYKWPFSACNNACELQALKIRAMFDWELDPVNEDSGLDDATKAALRVAREICQWKNVHHHFAVNDCSKTELRKRYVQFGRAESNFSATSASGDALIKKETESVSAPAQTPPAPPEMNEPAEKSAKQELFLSDAAQSAMNEIRGIFASCKGPKDLSQMFHTVVVACQIHRYTSTPMAELQVSSMDQMVPQAMTQIGNVFAATQGTINVWETRDAIVRATQIYRYQEEQGR